jgi:hypothetical protein
VPLGSAQSLNHGRQWFGPSAVSAGRTVPAPRCVTPRLADRQENNCGYVDVVLRWRQEKNWRRVFSTWAVPLWKQPFVVAMADFSLHLSPVDLDLFSEEACRIAGMEPVTLTDSLTEHVGGDGQTSSADVVSPQWVQTVGGILDHQVDDLAERWLVRVAEEHRDQPEEPNEDTRQTIRDLIRVCQIATLKRLAVVHVWSL